MSCPIVFLFFLKIGPCWKNVEQMALIIVDYRYYLLKYSHEGWSHGRPIGGRRVPNVVTTLQIDKNSLLVRTEHARAIHLSFALLSRASRYRTSHKMWSQFRLILYLSLLFSSDVKINPSILKCGKNCAPVKKIFEILESQSEFKR